MSATEISVAVPTCGRPESLARCLRALAAQTAEPAEVIVVDQAPSDRARDAVAGSGLAEIQYLEQPRLGPSASRNLALRAATAARLAVTDDDCVPDASWLAAVDEAFERSPRPGAVTGAILPVGDPPPGTYAVSLVESEVPVDHSGFVLPWEVGSGGNFAAPIATLRACGGWDERLGPATPGKASEDADLVHRLLESGEMIRYEPAAVVRHEWQPRERRLATRWSYGYGVGAMCGLWLRRGDTSGIRALLGYARLHLRPFAGGLIRRDRARIAEHGRALAGVAPGLGYGLRAARLPRSSIAVAAS